MSRLQNINDLYIFQVEDLSDIYDKYLKKNKGKDIEFSNNIDLNEQPNKGK